MFCPKCGAILQLKKDGRKTTMRCSCGYSSKKKEEIILRETVKADKGSEVEVIAKKVETLPKVQEECPKCKNKEAYYWLVQTRAGDESATRFFKCTKCFHTWRSYT